MTYQEIVRLLTQLPLDQQLMVLEEWTRMLRMALLAQQGQETYLQRGILKTSDRPPSDEEVMEAYTDYLVAKYLGDTSPEQSQDHATWHGLSLS
jgi:hypothetical protein